MKPPALLVSAITLATPVLPAIANETMLIIDDRHSGDLQTLSGNGWRLVTDGVMGGASRGRLTLAAVDGRPCLRLLGQVSLENNGGFVQAALDLSDAQALDAPRYDGLALDVYGNGETYNVHLRTADLRLPWQSYRVSFKAVPHWQTLRLPFASFAPHRTDVALNLHRLKRVGLVAIGREFEADLCMAGLAFYRKP